MATYSIKAIKYCEQSVPGPQMFFMSRWGEWMTADFFLFVLRRDDGKVILVDTGVRDVDEIQPLVVAGVGRPGTLPHGHGDAEYSLAPATRGHRPG